MVHHMAQFSTDPGKATCLANNMHITVCVNKSAFLASNGNIKSYNDKFWPPKDEANIISYLLPQNLTLFKLNS